MESPAYKVDLHIHSHLSGDNQSDPEECVIRAIERGMHGIAFTEHYSYEVSEPAEKLREKYRGSILILRGVEFSASEGHCLVFGVNTDRLSMKYAPVAELTQAVNAAGGVVIPSHPYRGVNSLGDRILTLKGIAAIEGYNGCNAHALNIRAVETAQRMQIPFTGGSDAHDPDEVGSCFTVFPERVTEENFIALLKAGNYRAEDTRKISRGWF